MFLLTSLGFPSSDQCSLGSNNDNQIILSLTCHVLSEKSTGWFNNHSGPSELLIYVLKVII